MRDSLMSNYGRTVGPWLRVYTCMSHILPLYTHSCICGKILHSYNASSCDQMGIFLLSLVTTFYALCYIFTHIIKVECVFTGIKIHFDFCCVVSEQAPWHRQNLSDQRMLITHTTPKTAQLGHVHTHTPKKQHDLHLPTCTNKPPHNAR